MKRLGVILTVLILSCSPLLAERIVKVEALSTDTTTFRQNKIQLNMAELAAQLVPYQSSVDTSLFALLAGRVGGQSIQGEPGADKARLELGLGGQGLAKLFADDSFSYLQVSSSQVYARASTDGTDPNASIFYVNAHSLLFDAADGEAQFEIDNVSGFDFTGTRMRFNVPAPSASTDTCFPGMFAWDASYIYVCTATDNWERTAVATW